MGWTEFADRLGRSWAINQEGLFLLVQAATRARLIRRRTRIVEINNGFFYPTSFQAETDWVGFRVAVEREVTGFYRDAAIRMADDPQVMWSNLAGMVESARSDMLACERMKHQAHHQTLGSIDEQGWNTAIARTTWVRDTAATLLVVTSGMLTGGASVAMLAGGSALRGVATYQDTGNAGAAVINAAGTMVVGSIGLGTSAVATAARTAEASARAIALISIKGAGVQAVAQSGATALQGYVEGRSAQAIVAQASTAAFYSFGGAALGPMAERFGVNFSTVTERMMMSARVIVSSAMDTQGNLAGNAMGVGSAPGTVTLQEYMSLPGGARDSGAAIGANVPPVRELRPNLLALARPLTRGNIDFAGIPLVGGLDSEYLQAHVIRRL